MPRGSAKSEQPPDTRSPSTLPAHRNRVRCRTSGPLDMTRALPPRSLRRRCENGCSRSCPEMLRRHSRIQRDEVEGPPPARILQRLRRRARLRCNRTLAPARQAPGTRSRRCTLAWSIRSVGLCYVIVNTIIMIMVIFDIAITIPIIIVDRQIITILTINVIIIIIILITIIITITII